jgi:hypothetical protein
MAHIRGIGHGGRPSADELANVWMLCRRHHDIYDGREHAGLKKAMGDLVIELLALRFIVSRREGT